MVLPYASFDLSCLLSGLGNDESLITSSEVRLFTVVVSFWPWELSFFSYVVVFTVFGGFECKLLFHSVSLRWHVFGSLGLLIMLFPVITSTSFLFHPLFLMWRSRYSKVLSLLQLPTHSSQGHSWGVYTCPVKPGNLETWKVIKF